MAPVAMIGYVVVVVAFLCFFYHCLWGLNKKSKKSKLGVLGMLPGLLRNAHRIHDYAAESLRKSGGNIEFRGPWFLNFSFFVTSDIANVQHMFYKNPANYATRGEEFREYYEMFGIGVFSADGDVWKSHKTLFLSLIKSNRFLSFFMKTVKQKVENDLFPILEHFSDSGISELDMQDIFQRFTFDNVCLMVLGFDPKCLAIDFPTVECEKALHIAEVTALRRNLVPKFIWKLERWLGIGIEKKAALCWKNFDKLLYQTISEKRQQLNAGKTQMKHDEEKEDDNFDLLTGCLVEELKKDTSSDALKISDKFLRDNAFNMMAAGRDGNGAGLTWLFGLVATHPEVENKILEEIKANVKVNEEGKMVFFNLEELNKLNYLHAVICEMVRLYPPVPFVPKFAAKAERLPSGHYINKNKKIIVSIYAMGRMENIWGKDCMEFKPERWLTESGEIVRVPTYKFMGFGSGPRSCIGKDLSFLQLKMVSSAVLWNYRFQLVEGHSLFPSNSIVLYLQHGLKVKVSRRCFR